MDIPGQSPQRLRGLSQDQRELTDKAAKRGPKGRASGAVVRRTPKRKRCGQLLEPWSAKPSNSSSAMSRSAARGRYSAMRR